MQTWLKFGVLVSLLALLCVRGNVRAQEENNSTICVEVSADVDAALEFATQQYQADFFREVGRMLLNENVTLQIGENNLNHCETITARIYFSTNRFLGSVVEFYFPDQDQLPINAQLSELSTALRANISYTSIAFPIHLQAQTMVSALLLYESGNCPEALAYFDELRTLDSEIYLAYIGFYSGNCHLLDEKYDTALEAFDQALFDPQDGNSLIRSTANNRAWVYIQIGQIENAIDLLGQLIPIYVFEINPSPYLIDTLSRRAQLYALASRDDDALADFNTAIELAPDYADAYFYRAVFFYTRTDYPAALDDFTHYLELAPDGEHASDTATYIDEIEQLNEAEGG